MYKHRATKADLIRALERVNRTATAVLDSIADQDPEGWKPGPIESREFRLDWANGGVAMVQACFGGVAERTVIPRGTKAETLHKMRAFVAGLDWAHEYMPEPPDRVWRCVNLPECTCHRCLP